MNNKLETKGLELIFLILIILVSSLTSAQIIGGEIFFNESINPNWQNVFIYNVEDVKNKYSAQLVKNFVEPKLTR